MALEKRKPVIFNMQNPRDKVLHDFADDRVRNWSGWVKDALERIARKHGITVPPKEQNMEPSADHGHESRQEGK